MLSHRSIQKIFQVAVIWLSFIVCVNAAQISQSDPISLLQGIASNMIAGLKSNQATLKTKPQIVYQLAKQYVVPYADLDEMSKRVIPPRIWDTASANQKSRFKKEFTTLLMRTYASGLTNYKDQVIQFYPIRGGTAGVNNVVVSSQIESSDRDPIRVTYRLLREGSVWRLYDMSVEGVSMLESFRSQFADILSNGNMDALLARLSSHNG